MPYRIDPKTGQKILINAATGMVMDNAPQNPQTQQTQQTQQSAQQGGGSSFVSDFLKAITSSARNFGGSVASVPMLAGSAIAGGVADVYQKATGKELKSLGGKSVKQNAIDQANWVANKVVTPQAQKAFSPQNPENQGAIPKAVIREGTKEGAGMASYLVPGGSTLKGSLALGAVSGSLFGLSEGENFDVDKIIGGAVGGTVGGAIAPVIGKAVGGVRSLVQKGATRVANSAAQGINRATPSMWQKALE